MTTTAPAPSGRAWLINALITVVLWGVWGAFSDQSPKHGFPDTLVYCVWAVTMIPPAFIALRMGAAKLELSGRAIAYGMAIGLLGAGGQMILFYTITRGPAYLIFPIISLSPLVTIVHVLRAAWRTDRQARDHRHRARADRAADLQLRSGGRHGDERIRMVHPVSRRHAVLGRAGLFHEVRQQLHVGGKHLLLHDDRRAAAGAGRAGG